MTTDEPWSADRALDADIAARAVGAACGDEAARGIRFLGAGWDYDAYETDAGWVFRFPRRADVLARMRREIVVLDWLDDRLGVPVPRFGWGELRAECFPHAFCGYRKLEGAHAIECDPAGVDMEALGETFGAALRRMHELRVPTDIVGRAGLETLADDARSYRDRRRKYAEHLAASVGGGLGRRALAFFDDDARLPAPGGLTPVLLHDDLHAEHLLLDEHMSGKMAGWLDWGDVALGDPARDFAPIHGWGGDRLLRAMVTGYGSCDEAMAARARYFCTCHAPIDWHHFDRVGNTQGTRWALAVLDAALP